MTHRTIGALAIRNLLTVGVIVSLALAIVDVRPVQADALGDAVDGALIGAGVGALAGGKEGAATGAAVGAGLGLISGVVDEDDAEQLVEESLVEDAIIEDEIRTDSLDGGAEGPNLTRSGHSRSHTSSQFFETVVSIVERTRNSYS